MCGSRGLRPSLNHFSTLYFKIGRVSCWTWSLPFQLAGLGRQPVDLPVSIPQCWGYGVRRPHLSLMLLSELRSSHLYRKHFTHLSHTPARAQTLLKNEIVSSFTSLAAFQIFDIANQYWIPRCRSRSHFSDSSSPLNIWQQGSEMSDWSHTDRGRH